MRHFRREWGFLLGWLLIRLAAARPPPHRPPKVTYAVNCGGPGYASKDGISYRADQRFSGGVVSDSGKRFKFPRVIDDTVYRTERYDTRTFSYTIPLSSEGHHTLVLKFSEVYFQSPQSKVFDVYVGGHLVIHHLDIFNFVGYGVPHDEYVRLVRTGQDHLTVNDLDADPKYWDRKHLTVQFIALPGKDNPKINAIVVYRGTLQEVPKLEPLPLNSRHSNKDIDRDIVGTDDTDVEEVAADHIDAITVNDEDSDDDVLQDNENELEGLFHARIHSSVFLGCIVVLLVSLYVLLLRTRSPPSKMNGKKDITREPSSIAKK